MVSSAAKRIDLSALAIVSQKEARRALKTRRSVLVKSLAVRVLKCDLAIAKIESVAREACGAGAVSDIGSPAKRVEGLTPGSGLVVEVSSKAASANSACVEAPTERILCSSRDDTAFTTNLIPRIARCTRSIRLIIFAERIDRDALIGGAEVVTIGTSRTNAVSILDTIGISISNTSVFTYSIVSIGICISVNIIISVNISICVDVGIGIGIGIDVDTSSSTSSHTSAICKHEISQTSNTNTSYKVVACAVRDVWSLHFLANTVIIGKS